MIRLEELLVRVNLICGVFVLYNFCFFWIFVCFLFCWCNFWSLFVFFWLGLVEMVRVILFFKEFCEVFVELWVSRMFGILMVRMWCYFFFCCVWIWWGIFCWSVDGNGDECFWNCLWDFFCGCGDGVLF